MSTIFTPRRSPRCVYCIFTLCIHKFGFQDDAAHQEKADKITTTIFDLMDKNHDGKITPEEFELAGLDSLPDFKDLGAEGHHYDIESGE